MAAGGGSDRSNKVLDRGRKEKGGKNQRFQIPQGGIRPHLSLLGLSIPEHGQIKGCRIFFLADASKHNTTTLGVTLERSPWLHLGKGREGDEGRDRVCVCVCVCERERERERE